MTPSLGHDRLLHRDVLVASLICKSAIHVGSGRDGAAVSATDLPLIRNGAGQPFIPGSSFRGILRSGLEALLRSMPQDLDVCDPLRRPRRDSREALSDPELSCSYRIGELKKAQAEKEPGETAGPGSAANRPAEDMAFELAANHSCEVCRLFGNTFLASRVWIQDLVLSKVATPYVRNGVGIDRDLRSAAKGILYDFEALPAGTEFELKIQVENAQDFELGLLLTGMELLDSGMFLLGGKRARGLGQVGVGKITMTRWKAADFFIGGEPPALDDPDLGVFRKAARKYYLEGAA